MIEAKTIDLLRFLAVALAFPSHEHLKVVKALAQALDLPQQLYPPAQEILEAQYHRLFSGMERCSPHETEYGPGRSVRKAVELADIAGFYRAFGLAIDSTDPEMVDHVSLEFDFLAHVAFKERYALLQGWPEKAEICSKAYRSFWADHLGRWVNNFLLALEKSAVVEGFYQHTARLALEIVNNEMVRLQLQPGSLQMDRSDVNINECLGCTLAKGES